MSEPLLELREVTKSFGAVRALRGVSFDLQPGEVHALLGENGAGKSTLIKIITGAHRPDSGTIHVQGEARTFLTPASAHKLGIACIYQQPALFPDLTVAENIALRLESPSPWRRVRVSLRKGRAAQLLERIGARIPPEIEARELSMPEQQLVEIACALGTGARILIMDEPTSSLPQAEQHRLLRIVDDIRATGAGVIYISHRLGEIFAVADRVTILRDGKSVGSRVVRSNPDRTEPSPESLSDGAQPPVVRESDLIQLMVGRELAHGYPPAESSPGPVVLSLQNVSCAAGGVRDVSLDVRAGEIVGFAGLVGAGRTELARVLFGLTQLDRGVITVNERPVVIRSPRDAVACGISYVPEDRRRHGVILEMPVASNVSMAIHRQLFPRGWLRFDAERTLAAKYICDLSIKASGPEAPAISLSGGNQQKVSLARWLATNPKILILDEPTQGVDIGAKSEIHRIIRELAREGMAVLLISSDLPEVLGMSHRVAVMRGGTIVRIFSGQAKAHYVMAAALGQRESEGAGRNEQGAGC